MVVFMFDTALKARFPSPKGGQLNYPFVFKCAMPLLAAATEPSVTTLALLALFIFKLVFVCPAFSRVCETAWWNTEVQLAALRHRGNKKGIKTFTLWHYREQMLLILKQLAHTLLYSMRNERIITLIMSDTRICKHTQFNVKIVFNFLWSFSLSSFFFISVFLCHSAALFLLTAHKLGALLFTTE